MKQRSSILSVYMNCMCSPPVPSLPRKPKLSRCRLVPFYVLLAKNKIIHQALYPFKELYFDLDELEKIFDEKLDFLRRTRPDKIKEEGALSKETEEALETIVTPGRKQERGQGPAGDHAKAERLLQATGVRGYKACFNGPGTVGEKENGCETAHAW